MKREDKKYKIVIECERHKILEIYTLSQLLQEHLKQDKDIPTNLLKKFIDLFEVYNRFPEVEKNYNEIIERCYDYLKNCGCDFSVKKVVLSSPEINITNENKNRIVATYEDPKLLKVELGLHDLLKKCFSMIISFEVIESLRIDKKGMIEFIYDIANSYNIEIGKNRLSDYKVHIITGIIATSLGILDTSVAFEKSKPNSEYNKILHQEVRNIRRKKLPYSPLKY